MSTEAEITPYAKAWAEFKNSPDYYKSINELSKKGMKHPYIDNILRCAFDAGWLKRNRFN